MFPMNVEPPQQFDHPDETQIKRDRPGWARQPSGNLALHAACRVARGASALGRCGTTRPANCSREAPACRTLRQRFFQVSHRARPLPSASWIVWFSRCWGSGLRGLAEDDLASLLIARTKPVVIGPFLVRTCGRPVTARTDA
jgi:hypothetical protein